MSVAVEINDAQLKVIMRLKPTIEDVAAYFECSSRTIARYIESKYSLNFKEFRHQHMVHTRHDLIRKAIEMATGGNVPMLIFCLKNLCDWKDRPELERESEGPEKPTVTLSDEQLEKLIKAARGLKAV